MLRRVFLPQLGQTMEEGTVARWLKAEGDRVEKGEILYELTTDKATLEVEAFASGIVKKIVVPAGQTVPVNRLIAVLGDEGDEVPADLLTAAQAGAPGGRQDAAGVGPGAGGGVAAPSSTPERPAEARVGVSPRARKAAGENLVPLGAVRGSGPGGRIVERDVLDYLDGLGDARFTPMARRLAYEKGVDLLAAARAAEGRRVCKEDVLALAEAGPAPAAPEGERIELSPMRRTIAERMTRCKQTVPHFYLAGEVLMDAAVEFMERARAESGERITLTALIVKAMGLALRAHPRANARFEGGAVVLNRRCNVGVAVAVEDGLFVPVVRDADSKDLPAIARELKSLGDAARAGRLIPEQYEGGSITLSNLGMFGVDFFQPIINPPESMIVGVGAVRQVPVVRDGALGIARVMQVAISADHRCLDGASAAEFYRTLKELLEGPARLILLRRQP